MSKEKQSMNKDVQLLHELLNKLNLNPFDIFIDLNKDNGIKGVLGNDSKVDGDIKPYITLNDLINMESPLK